MPAYLPQQNTILIIDDDIHLIRLLSQIVKEFGRVLFATNGEQGIAIAKEHKPDLILLDVGMVSMDGYEVCRRIKEDEITSQIAIIFVTANNGMESEIACFEAGAVDFISKPLNPPVVQARVRTHLRLIRNTSALEALAQRDALTGLYNRGYFDKAIEAEYKRLQRHQLPLGIALIDIDYFKKYNDTYGHIAGDQTLRQVAEALQKATKRPGELVARYGGEEFIALLPQVNEDMLKQYGQMICDAVHALQITHQASAVAEVVTTSVGLFSAIPSADCDPQAFIKQADQALYCAKEKGRNQFQLCRLT